MENLFIGWIIFFIFICLVEVATQQLVAIWFASGSLVCVFLSYFGFDLSTQLLVFIAVSLGTMLLLRPYALRRLKTDVVATNADDLIGKKAIAVSDFDAVTKEGRVAIAGLDWAAKAIHGETIKNGQEVEIQQIEGVTLFVTREDISCNG